MQNDLTLGRFFSGLIGACEGAIVAPALAVPRIARHLPRAVNDLYAVIYRTNSIGPNLKGLSYAIVPLTALSVPGLLTAASALAGLYYGADAGVDGELSAVLTKIKKITDQIDHFLIKDFLPSLREFEAEPLEPGQKPLDIPLYEMVRGIVSGGAAGMLGSPLMGLAIAVHIPEMYIKVSKKVATMNDLDFLLKLFVVIMFNEGFAFVPAIVAFGSVGYQVAQGAIRGYKHGFLSGIKHAFSDPWDAYRTLGKILKKMD